MREAFDPSDASRTFCSLPAARQMLFFSLYAAELTILARGHFVDGEVGRAQQCNETMHRTLGYLSRLLRDQIPAPDSSFFDALVKGAKQNGWTYMVAWSLKHASKP
jgi:hypothetical protein